MKKIILIFLTVGIPLLQVFSQTGSAAFNPNLDVMLKFNELKLRDPNAYTRIEGSPYFTDDFVNSKIYFTRGDSVGASIRYDLYKDELEFNRNDQIVYLDKSYIRKVRMGNELLEVHKYKLGEEVLTGCFFCIKCGKNSLLKKVSVVFKEAEGTKGYQDALPNRFEKNDDEYFLSTEDGQFFKVKNKNDLEINFAGKPEITKFIKDNKIKPGKEKDLLKLIDYLNLQK
ncbi:MAG: hypothetical protein Q8907_04925 [Bacteroidota bacterium]|nr:hypothetical protein [Bacteroidota bacterium]MDP4225108.1 hypothetical protein [Bacteroidota bacterium]MDP4273605.1 hypothetical protein [Bacteroidota bacterium]